MELTGSMDVQQNTSTNPMRDQRSLRGHRSRGRNRGQAGRLATSSRSTNAIVTENVRALLSPTIPPSIAPVDQPARTGLANVNLPAPPPTSRGRKSRGRIGRPDGRSATVNGRGGSVGTPASLNHRVTHTQNDRRQFGSQLTSASQITSETLLGPGLHAEAIEFTPGQPHQQRSIPRRQGNPQNSGSQRNTRHGRRDSSLRSTANDIATRTHEDIANGLYECSICTSEIARSSKVWSCKICWTVFHLGCIKQWSKNDGSTVAQPRQVDVEALPRQWRCPGCNLPKDDLPSHYTCWCEKEISPRTIPGMPPHSCGQTCSKPRMIPKQCPHPCELTCHAGPCPPCSHMGPEQSCYCGKRSLSQRCVDTDYENGWGCGDICGDIMPCGEHACAKFCHEGLCGACEAGVDGVCYCGKVEKSMTCNDKGDEKQSQGLLVNAEGVSTLRTWMGVFDCGGTCERTFDCGKHKCERTCHEQDAETSHCPWSPDVISRCPCGKTPLTALSAIPRISCDVRIPNCAKECSRVLSCGHVCQRICHLGNCPPCSRTVDVSCRCGRVSTPGICHQHNDEPPMCMRICKVTLNCGRHDCGEHCCPGEKKAVERLALKRKLRPLNSHNGLYAEGFEAEHICMRVCDRPLKCGNHRCPDLCHKGPCGSCREAIFEEIGCHCGRTVLQPPLPCGTGPPPCRYECERNKACGHPQVSHNCHGDHEACPKCPFLLEKPCMCEKKTLKNQPCFLADVRCGELCGKKIRCGSHYCRKPCHRPGDCEDSSVHCQQLCGKPKQSCGHPCEERCHSPSACKELKPCTSKVIITCDCQHLKTETKCQASRTSEGSSKKSLKCDEECARLERNRMLALALNIDPETYRDDHVPYSAQTLQMFQDSTKWAQSQERELRAFAADDTAKRLRFKPMQSHQRSFIHSVSEDFGFDTESLDPEPHRHVCVFKTPRFVKAPMKTLADCTRLRASATTGASASASASTFQSQQKLLANNNLFNGFILTGPRFGLTLDELRADFSPAFATVPTLLFDIEFLPSEEIVLKARPSSPRTTITPPALETALKACKASVATIVASKKLATSVALCALDPSLNILRKEAEAGSASGGWSQVAAKGSAPRVAPKRDGVGSKSSFVVLGKKKMAKKEEEGVVEDWEEEMKREEKEEEEKECRDEEHVSRSGQSEEEESSGAHVGDKELLNAEVTPAAENSA